MAKKTFEYTDFIEDWNNLEEKVGRNFRDYAGKYVNHIDGDRTNNKPYQDFWHFFIDVYDYQIRNDTYLYDINWVVVYNAAKEDWQREIAQLFINTYGTDNHNYWLSW